MDRIRSKVNLLTLISGVGSIPLSLCLRLLRALSQISSWPAKSASYSPADEYGVKSHYTRIFAWFVLTALKQRLLETADHVFIYRGCLNVSSNALPLDTAL